MSWWHSTKPIMRYGCGQCFVGEFGGGGHMCACVSCWVSVVRLLSECTYFRGVGLCRLSIKNMENCFEQLTDDEALIRVMCGDMACFPRSFFWKNLYITSEKLSRLDLFFVLISHKLSRKAFVEVPDVSTIRIQLCIFPGLPFVILICGRGRNFSSPYGTSLTRTNALQMEDSVKTLRDSVSRLLPQGLSACVVAPRGRRIVVASGCWCGGGSG